MHFFEVRAFGLDTIPLAEQVEPFRVAKGLVHAGRKLNTDDGYVAIDVQRLSRHFARGVFRKARLKDLPRKIREDGESAPLGLLATEGLDYTAHWAWFNLSHCKPGGSTLGSPLRGVLVYEANYFAPRATLLGKYLNHLLKEQYRVTIVPLLDPDALAKLKKSQNIKSILVRATRSPNDSSGIARLFGTSPPHTQRLEAIFRPAKNGRYDTQEVLAEIEDYLSSRWTECVRVETEEGDSLDLINEKVEERAVVPMDSERERVVRSEDMFKELGNAFNRRRDDLCQSFGLRWAEPPVGIARS